MRQVPLALALLGCLWMTGCGAETPGPSLEGESAARGEQLFIQAAGMVKALGIT